MNSFRQFALPKLKHADDFEDIVLASLSLKWTGSDLQKHGRSGQKQRGVDIYGSDDLERPVGIQCKNLGTPLNKTTILREIEKSEEFPNLNTYYMATADSRDAKLQLEVRALSKERVAAGKFALGILFWDDIIGYLTLSPQIFGQFFPEYSVPDQSQKDIAWQHRAAFDLGVYDIILPKYKYLASHGHPFAVSNPERLFNEYINILLAVRVYVTALFTQEISRRINNSIQVIIAITDKETLNKDDLELLYQHGDKLTTFMSGISTHMATEMARIFTASRFLQKCLEDGKTDHASRFSTLLSVATVLPGFTKDLIEIRDSVPLDDSSPAWVYQIKELIINKVIWGSQ